MRISDWSSDVCSSDLVAARPVEIPLADLQWVLAEGEGDLLDDALATDHALRAAKAAKRRVRARSEEHTSELQSLMRISYAVFCLKKKKNTLHTEQSAT